MKKNMGRTLTTFAGILVMVVLMTAVFVGKDTVIQFMTDVITENQGSWHAQVYGLDQAQVQAVKELPYVTETEVSRPLGYTLFAQSGNPDETPYLELKGYSGELFDWMGIHVKEGRLPEAEGELIISERAIREGSTIQVGDVIEVNAFERLLHAFSKGEDDQGFIVFSQKFVVGHGETVKVPDHFPYYTPNNDFEILRKETGLRGSYTVVGIMESPYYEMSGQGGYMALVKTDSAIADGETVNLVLQTDLGKVDDMGFDLNEIVNSARTEEELDKLRKNGHSIVATSGEHIPVENGRVVVNDMLLTVAGKGTDGTLNLLMMFFQAFFIVLITAASLVLIYNVFNLSFRERSRYLGMLSSVGATKSQKKWSVYYEILLLLAAALPLGILLGLLVVKGGMALLLPHFTRILGMVADNVINARNVDLECHIVVNPLNLLLVAAFSLLATWISAMIPARKISKVGPIESIRGNEGAKSKTYKTDLRKMRKSKAESLIASASVTRNAHSTKGIVRSIAAFLTLTLITAFASKLFSDIVEQKGNNENLISGSEYQGYQYAFYLDGGEEAEGYRQEIMSSEEVTKYKETYYALYSMNLWMDRFSKEYFESREKLVGEYFPGGIPEEIRKIYLEPEYEMNHPVVNKIVLSDEDFRKVAKKAGVRKEFIFDSQGADRQDGALSNGQDGALSEKQDGSWENARVPALIYDQAELSTDNLEINFGGAIKPSYTRYQVKHPLACEVGENVGLFKYDYMEDKCVSLPIYFAGYVGADAFRDFYDIRDGQIWVILPESGNRFLKEHYDIAGMEIDSWGILFSAKEDSGLVRRLSLVTDEFGNSMLHSAEMSMQDFQAAISQIVKIVATCFTLLVAVICLLNLYNSVMGRRLALLREQAILQSLGMTKRQEGRILFYENARLMLWAVLWSAGITALFVFSFHRFLSARFGRLIFHMPTGIVLATLAVSGACLVLFTKICYHKGMEGSLSEEIRNENT